MKKTVKLSNGKKVEVYSIKWKVAKAYGITPIIHRILEGKVQDEDIDKIVSIFIPDEAERDELEYVDALEIFNAFATLISEKK